MSKKIEITPTKAAQFDIMLNTLKRIARHYESTEKLRKGAEKDYGLDYEEVLEMAYENIQAEAKMTIKGISPINNPIKS